MRPLFFLLSVLLLWSCDPFGDTYSDIEKVVYYESGSKTPAPDDVEELLVMTWNIKFGGGRIDFWFDCYGDRVLMTVNEVIDNLQGVADYINQVQPDILLLQEVDVNSKRCAYIDQLQWILDNTDLNYAVYASQWLSQFVPSDGLGPVDSGNAILSRWPVSNAERIKLDLRTDQDVITRYFYLKRNILKTQVEVPGQEDLWALNIHTAAYSQDGTKEKHLNDLKDEMDEMNAETGRIIIAGGDFNTLPPTSVKFTDFPDSICEDEDFQGDDYTEELTWLEDFYDDYFPAITLDVFGTTEDVQVNFYTHTVQGPPDGHWSRKLDYLFTNNTVPWHSADTHQNTMDLSDHCPVTAILEVN